LDIERVDDDAKSQEDTVTLDMAQTKDFKTLLEACRSQGIAIDDDPLSFKEKIASTLGENEDCKRFFHNWSLSDGDKSFAAEDPIQEGNPLLRRAKGMLHGVIDYGVNTIQYYQTIAAHMGIGRPPLTSNPLQLVDPAVREEYNRQWIEAVTHMQAYDKQGIDNTIMKTFSVNPQDPLYQSYREWTEFTLDHMGTVRDAYHSIKDIFGAGKNIGGRTHITDSNPKNEIKFFDSPSSSDVSHRTKYPHSDIWKHETEFKGIRVFQRDDLINPHWINPKTGETNLQRMQRGRAPIGADGKEINLHHTIQRQGYPMAEVSGSFHKKYHGTIHVNPSTIPSGIPRNVHANWREKYWVERAKDFIPKTK
jgi:filamentous hemagglutinin